MAIGTVESVDYAQASVLAADVAEPQDNVVGNARFAHYGNATNAASAIRITETVTENIL